MKTMRNICKAAFSLIAHELMHGFASSELVEQYLTFMESNRYLRATHHALLTDMHSGDEEEFVMAAEYYILCRCGILTEEQIVQRNADRYNGCVPLSLYIFRHLVKEQPAAGYDGWLRARFSDGTFRPQEVVSVIDAILPAPSDQGCFFTSFFSVLSRCAYVIRSFQTEAEDMLRERLEAHTGCRFMPSAGNVVRFGRERLAPNADGVSLASIIAAFFVSVSNEVTFPMLTFLSAGLINFFVPSGGGQWAVQGPIMMPAGAELDIGAGRTAMAIAWGDQWTNMIQPFWALPALGIAKLSARDIMGYLVVVLLFVGLVACLGFLAWGLLF